MKIEISGKISNQVQWDTLRPGDVVSWGGNIYLAFSMGNSPQFLQLDGFKAVSLAYVIGLKGLPVLMDSTLQVSHVGAELVQVKDPWEWYDFDSSWMREGRYNRETKVFEIITKEGNIYQYKDVPDHKWDNLIEAWSHGSYYNANIKGQYERIE